MANQYGDPSADDQRPYGQPAGGPPGYGQPYGTPPPGYQTGPMAQPGGYAFGAPRYAGWLSRVGSYVLDFLPAWILYAIGGFISGHAGGTSPASALLDLAALGWIIENRWFRAGRTGQSRGKSVLKTRLVDERTGQPIGAGMAFVRDIAHLVDAVVCYVGFLFPLWDSKRQTIADKFLHTVVVREDGGNGYGSPQR
jgi:uncharacterized RDD family membrane protein YckC